MDEFIPLELDAIRLLELDVRALRWDNQQLRRRLLSLDDDEIRALEHMVIDRARAAVADLRASKSAACADLVEALSQLEVARRDFSSPELERAVSIYEEGDDL